VKFVDDQPDMLMSNIVGEEICSFRKQPRYFFQRVWTCRVNLPYKRTPTGLQLLRELKDFLVRKDVIQLLVTLITAKK